MSERSHVAVLGAGGTIAPALVRDLAESDEVVLAAPLDLDARPRAGRRRAARAAARRRARQVDARAGLSATRSRSATCW